MTTSAAVQWRKEVRELLPWWCAIVLGMLACWALMHPDLLRSDAAYRWALGLHRRDLLITGLCIYGAGAVTLGALSIGHEYAHHTLPALLTQPIGRGRLLAVKLGVLAPLLLFLGAVAFGALRTEPDLVGNYQNVQPLLRLGILPLAGGLFLAPWLTMVCRGTLGGAVFTVALPVLLWAGAAYFRLEMYFAWLATLGLAGVGGLLTWRSFMRLEVAGGSQSDVDLTAWLGRSTGHVRVARTQRPVWLLAKKELRLQQPALVVSGVYAVAWLTINFARTMAPDRFPESALFVMTFVHGLLVPSMIGALAFAEDVRLGVTQWHALLPFAVGKQWTIKVGLSITLAVALAVVLQGLLQTVAVDLNPPLDFETPTIVVLCIAALYISSLSSSGLRALLVAGAAIPVAVLTAFEVLMPVAEAAQPAVNWLAKALPIVKLDPMAFAWWIRYGFASAAAGLAGLLLVFSYANHRTADRSVGRAIRQIAWLSAYVVAAGIFVRLISQVIYVWLKATAAQ